MHRILIISISCCCCCCCWCCRDMTQRWTLSMHCKVANSATSQRRRLALGRRRANIAALENRSSSSAVSQTKLHLRVDMCTACSTTCCPSNPQQIEVVESEPRCRRPLPSSSSPSNLRYSVPSFCSKNDDDSRLSIATWSHREKRCVYVDKLCYFYTQAYKCTQQS